MSDEEDAGRFSHKPIVLTRLTRLAATKFTFRELIAFLTAHPNLSKDAYNELIANYNGRIEINARTDPDRQYSAYPLIRLLIPSYDQRRTRLKKARAKEAN